MSKDDYKLNIYTPSERLYLVYTFILKHANRTEAVKPKQIYDYLETFDIYISNKTLYADLEKIRTTMKLDVQWDNHKQGYLVLNPPFEPQELRLLVDSVQAAKFITQEQARTLSKKIADMADKYTEATMKRMSYVSNRIHSENESVVKEADRIHLCIQNDQKIGFRYFHYAPDKKKKYSKNGEQYIVSPFALLWNDGYYYLYAYSSEKNDFRHYRIDRMERIRIINEPREGKEEFRKKDLTSRQTKIFNMFSGKECSVRLRCINSMADIIIDRFGKNSMLIPDDDSHFIVPVTVEVSEQFYAWLCSFGRRIKVISPDYVVDGMTKYVSKLSSLYNDNGEK